MKNSISLSLPSFEQYFPRGSFTSSAFGITGLDLSSPLASSEFDSKLVVVVRCPSVENFSRDESSLPRDY